MKEKMYLLTESELKEIAGICYVNGTQMADNPFPMPDPISVPDDEVIEAERKQRGYQTFQFDNGAQWAINEILKTKRK